MGSAILKNTCCSFRRPRVPAPTWQLTNLCNSIPRASEARSNLLEHQVHTWRKNRIHKKKTNNQKNHKKEKGKVKTN